MSNKMKANDGIELIFTKEDSDFVVYARKDGETRHFFEESDLPSAKATALAEIMVGIDFDAIPVY